MFCRLLWECVTGEFFINHKTICCNTILKQPILNIAIRFITYACMLYMLFSQSFRRCGYSIRSARQTLELWQGIMKEIGGKFGTSVLSYFLFLKWLLVFNIFSFVVNFGFITIPLLVSDPSPDIPLNVSFRGLEILTGAVSGGFYHTTYLCLLVNILKNSWYIYIYVY